MKIGYQGIAGSYSEMALRTYAKEQGKDLNTEVEAVSYDNFPDNIQDLLDGKLDLTIVPVENSTTGTIFRVTDLFKGQDLMAIDEVFQPVEHILWSCPDASLETIKEVYSHPEALSQCTDFFRDHPDFKQMEYFDTSRAAALIQESQDPTMACIASERAGELYGLTPILKNIQDESSNTTRFYVMEKRKANKDYKGSMLVFYLEVAHETGSLSKVLQVFSILKCNLMNLNSRPIDDQPFAYGFYLEVSTKDMIVSQDTLLEILDNTTHNVQLIGQYYPVPNHRKQ